MVLGWLVTLWLTARKVGFAQPETTWSIVFAVSWSLSVLCCLAYIFV